ncbi:MAG: FAD-dependent oxidoreductase [Geminicoccaceae bacterium]
MHVLIVGAGIAGLALAGLLKRRGLAPQVVERATDFSHLGYALGLYPLGSRVLHGLGVHDDFLARSRPMETYRVCDGSGTPIRDYALGELFAPYGSIGMIERAALMDLLSAAACGVPIAMTTTVTSLDDRGDEVRVGFSDGSSARFDLVVGADGVHSQVRGMVFGALPLRRTGWGGWFWWAAADPLPQGMALECWGAGRMLGTYAMAGRAAVFAGGPLEATAPEVLRGSALPLRRHFAGLAGAAAGLLDSVPEDLAGAFFWQLDDLRADRWVHGRVALIGDAACGFLPTAGVGASMALESAAVLADELTRTDARRLPLALSLYERRRKRRTEGAQTDSRRIARLMFVRSGALAAARDVLLRFLTAERVMRNIVKSHAEPI